MASSEALLISAVVQTGDIITPMVEGINPKIFTDAFRDEWEFIEDYWKKHNRPPSKVLFKKKFPKFTLYRVDDVDHLINDLKQEHARRTLITILRDTADDIHDAKDPLAIANTYSMALSTMQAELVGREDEMDLVVDWDQTYKEVSQRVERRMHDGTPGIPTGFPSVDDRTGGIHPGHYWVVAARLGQGKTWMLIRMALQAMYLGRKVQYIALEQSRKDIAMRMHSFMSKHYGYQTFKSLDLNLGQGFDIIAYKKMLKDLKGKVPGNMLITDSARGRVDGAYIGSLIERNHPDIVFVDYLTLMAKEDNDWQSIAKLSSDIKNLCQRYEIPIVVAAQINRTGSGKEPPRTEALSGSDAIGQDADAVITMAQQSEHLMKFRMAKYRHGPDGYKWFAEFTPNTGLFEEITGDRATTIRELDNSLDDDEI